MCITLALLCKSDAHMQPHEFPVRMGTVHLCMLCTRTPKRSYAALSYAVLQLQFDKLLLHYDIPLAAVTYSTLMLLTVAVLHVSACLFCILYM
jgi:hypothetical protein